MAKERIVATKFWTDNYIAFLDPIEKLLFLYFITNPLTNISGVYEITLKQIGFDTGIDPDMIRKILDRFERDGKIFYRVGWIGIRNFIKNQHTNSGDVQSGIKRELNLAPQEIITATFGRASLQGGGRVGGISHILNLTKPNLTYIPDSAKKPNPDVPDSEIELIQDEESFPLKVLKRKELMQHKGYDPAQTNQLLKWGEAKLGRRYPKPLKQKAAIASMLASGYPIEEIKAKWAELEESDFWQEKGIDFSIVLSQISKHKSIKTAQFDKWEI